MESLIRRRLVSNEELVSLLAKFETEPAIFYQKAPDDTDTQERFYPHVILTTDKYSDAQKGVAGILTVDVITSQMTTPPEPLEKLIRESLEGVFFRGEEIFSLKWQRTDVFTEPASERLPLVFGATLTFEIYEYPQVETSTPDPIEGMNFWASCFDENLMIIGETEFEEFYVPTREKPAIYFDVATMKMTELKSEAAFLDVVINVHLFAPTVKARREWLAMIHQELLLVKGIILADESPMRLQSSEYNWAASETDGQIKLKYNYGIMRRERYAHTVSKVILEEEKWQTKRQRRKRH